MTQKIVVQTVIVFRSDKQVVPEIGKVFDFTDAELKDIERLNPDAVRDPVNEAPAEATKAGGKTAAKTDL